MSQDDDIWAIKRAMIPTMNAEQVTKLFDDMLASKNKKIADLQKALDDVEFHSPRSEDDQKIKASDEAQDLAVIRGKLEKFKRITKAQYDNLVKFTDPATASIRTHGDNIAERRRKVIMSFQYVWNTIMPRKKKIFTPDDESFGEMVTIIKHLVKEGSSSKGTPATAAASTASKKTEEDIFKETLKGIFKSQKDSKDMKD